jgi:3-hydroxybutyryl-CoA dehydrogenase
MSIKNITILGAGLMGTGLAQVFAADTDAHVTVRSRTLRENPDSGVRANTDLLVEKGALTRDEAEGILSRIRFTDDLAAALEDADLVVENVPEDLRIKQDLFRDIEPLVREDTILATDTSVMRITEIASKSENRDRIVGTHFWNPPYLIPLVEVVKGEETSQEVLTKTYEYLKKLGKKPVLCRKDVPGFIANRLQHALWREALSIVEQGIADPATVDEALRYGPGLRWPVLGVLENADMIGLDLALAAQTYIVKHLEDAHEPSALLREHVKQGELGFKTGKGYQEWTPEQIAESNTRLREHLIKATKDLERDNQGGMP